MSRSPIEFQALAEALDLPALMRREGIEVRNGKAFCPFHDNSATPSLSIYLADGRWRYRCHGCGVKGDAIAWVAAREGISVVEAVEKLGGSPSYQVEPPSGHRVVVDRPVKVEAWRDPEWQEVADHLIADAESRLWSPEGRGALGWLRARGLADNTIRRFRLGFVAQGRASHPIAVLHARDGEHGIYTPRGITLPWVAPGCDYNGPSDLERPRWVGCNVRCLADPDVFAPLPERVMKCLAFRGSSRGCLYPWPDILPTQGQQPMLLVEGEFDALIGFQEVGHLLHVATAGSASVQTLPIATRSALALTTWLFLGFDHDEAGVEAVWKWKEKYPHKARRVLLPAGKDLNEFILGGGDARAWVSSFGEFLERAIVTLPGD